MLRPNVGSISVTMNRFRGGGEMTIFIRENEEENDVVTVTLFHPKRFRCRVSGDKAYVRWLSNFFMTHILLSSSPNT